MKRVGVDCIGLLVGVAKELDLKYEDYTNYDMRPDPDELLRFIGISCDRVYDDPRKGDILLFWFVSDNRPQHAGILVNHSRFIHTYASIGKVMEHDLTAAWKKHLHSVWRYRWQH